MKMGDYIKYLRLEKGWSQEELGEKCGVKKAAVNKWEKGSVENIKRSTIEKMAELFDVSPCELMCFETKSRRPSSNNFSSIEIKRFPILGTIACGEPILASEEKDLYVEVGTDIICDFCLIAKGDSMIDARIHNGDIVFIRSQPQVNNGEIAAVIIDNEATLKRVYYYKEKGLLILKAANPAYEDMIYSEHDLEGIRIIGKAVAFQSDIK